MITTQRFVCTHLLLLWVCSLWYLLLFSGCGGGGSSASPTPTDLSRLRLTLEWNDYGRSLQTPASALSCRVELFRLGSSVSDGAEHTWMIERDALPTRYSQTWLSPTLVKIGSWHLVVTCYAEHQAQGAIVAKADENITLDQYGNGADTITFISQAASIQVDDISLQVGQRQSLACVVRDMQGSVVAVSPSSIAWRILDGDEYVQLFENEIEAITVGTAHAQATVNGISSQPGKITIIPIPNDHRTKTIMALGDSITVGLVSHTSYRYYLWKMLMAAGYTDIDFVGSQSGIGDGREPLDHDWDEDHEGHSGWDTNDILYGYSVYDNKLTGPDGWAMVYKPDIVLILLGTNDLGNGITPEDAILNIESIIHTLRSANPSVCIGLAQLTPARSDYEAIPNLTDVDYRYLLALNTSIKDFNQRIVDCTARLNTTQSPVVAVDLYTILDPLLDVPESVHPNDAGSQKMAQAWYPVVTNFLRHQ